MEEPVEDLGLTGLTVNFLLRKNLYYAFIEQIREIQLTEPLDEMPPERKKDILITLFANTLGIEVDPRDVTQTALDNTERCLLDIGGIFAYMKQEVLRDPMMAAASLGNRWTFFLSYCYPLESFMLVQSCQLFLSIIFRHMHFFHAAGSYRQIYDSFDTLASAFFDSPTDSERSALFSFLMSEKFRTAARYYEPVMFRLPVVTGEPSQEQYQEMIELFTEMDALAKSYV